MCFLLSQQEQITLGWVSGIDGVLISAKNNKRDSKIVTLLERISYLGLRFPHKKFFHVNNVRLKVLIDHRKTIHV